MKHAVGVVLEKQKGTSIEQKLEVIVVNNSHSQEEALGSAISHLKKDNREYRVSIFAVTEIEEMEQ